MCNYKEYSAKVFTFFLLPIKVTNARIPLENVLKINLCSIRLRDHQLQLSKL